MRFTVLRSNKSCFTLDLDKQHHPPLVNHMRTTRQWEIQNSMFQTPVDSLIPNFEGFKTWFELSRAKLYRNDLRVETKTTSSYREVRVFKGSSRLRVKKNKCKNS